MKLSWDQVPRDWRGNEEGVGRWGLAGGRREQPGPAVAGGHFCSRVWVQENVIYACLRVCQMCVFIRHTYYTDVNSFHFSNGRQRPCGTGGCPLHHNLGA